MSHISRLIYNFPKSNGSLCLPYHYEMISDEKRIEVFKSAINKVCKDKIVLESGTGTGILSILAAKAGAKKIYAVEIDPLISEVARKNFRRGNHKNITLIQKNFMDLNKNDLEMNKVDVVIAENLSTWQVIEPEIQVMNHAIKEELVSPNAVFLPSVIMNMMELAHTKYIFEDSIKFKTYYFQFSGIKEPLILSEKNLFSKIDLSKLNRTKNEKEIKIMATRNGTVNSLRLTSPTIVYNEIQFNSSDSMLPPVVVPLERKIKVKMGDIIHLDISYSSFSNWDDFKVVVNV